MVAALVWYRQQQPGDEHVHPRHPLPVLIVVGGLVAVVGGMFGVGGPLLTVPLLVAIGTSVLPALAASQVQVQVQSIITSIVGSVGYLGIDAIYWPNAAVVGVPELLGVSTGWRIAHAVPSRYLGWAMIIVLVAVVPVPAFTS